MNHLKKLLCVVLTLAMVFAMGVPAFAAGASMEEIPLDQTIKQEAGISATQYVENISFYLNAEKIPLQEKFSPEKGSYNINFLVYKFKPSSLSGQVDLSDSAGDVDIYAQCQGVSKAGEGMVSLADGEKSH